MLGGLGLCLGNGAVHYGVAGSKGASPRLEVE